MLQRPQIRAAPIRKRVAPAGRALLFVRAPLPHGRGSDQANDFGNTFFQ